MTPSGCAAASECVPLEWHLTVVDGLRQLLEDEGGVRLAVLFGSTARRTAGGRSDIDIGISLVPGTELSVAFQVALERAAGRSVDIIWLDTAPPLLRIEVARDGIVLVERDPHAWSDFRAHAMIDWWDWAPTLRMMHRVVRERLRVEAGHGSA